MVYKSIKFEVTMKENVKMAYWLLEMRFEYSLVLVKTYHITFVPIFDTDFH